MKRISVVVLLVLFSVVFATSTLYAQGTATSGILRGTVTDPNGAVVAGAQITLTNQATAFTRHFETSSVGAYTANDLPPGAYNMTIDAPGFRQAAIRNVVINVASVTEQNTKLELGARTETVTVEATNVAVQTTSAAIGEVVDSEQATQLPLNGSNFVELTQLQPGVSRTNNLSTTNKGLLAGVDFSVNGNPTTNNLFLIDGANNNDVGSNRTILIYPSVDSISEFKMLRNSYGPEYGQASGAVVSILTKSGGNAYHGSVNYSGRNDAVSAEDPFAKAQDTALFKATGNHLPHNGKDELRRNDVIWTFGGPIKKDKIFFFASQEFNREIRGFTRQSCVPTAAEYAGDFSKDFNTPSGTDQCGAAKPTLFPGTASATNPLKIANPSPAAQAILAQFPLPNVPASAATNFNNWVLSTPSPLDYREENFRVDFNLTNKEVLTLRYTQDHFNNPAPNLASSGQGLWGEDPFPAIESSWSQPSKDAIAKVTSTLSSTLVNEAQFSYSGNAIYTSQAGSSLQLSKNIQAAFPTYFPSSTKLVGGIPTFWGGGLGQYFSYGSPNIWSIAPYQNNMDLYQIRDDISKVMGSHSFKAGVFLSWNAKNENQYGGQDSPVIGSAEAWNTPANNNWGAQTGNDLANFLSPGERFGITEQNVNPTDQARWRDYEFYVGDTWKVSPRLTAEYGFRWSFLREPYSADNAVGAFLPSAYNPANAFVKDSFGNFQPNLCNGITVVQGSNLCQNLSKITGVPYSNGTPTPFGRALVPNNNHLIAPRLGIAWDPRGNGKLAIRAGVGQFFQRERVSYNLGLNNALPNVVTASSVLPSTTGIAPCPNCNMRTLDQAPAPGSILFTGTPTSKDYTGNVPNTWQWNLAVEQELYRDTALEVAYIGNKGLHLSTALDLNSILPQNRAQADFTSPGNPQQQFRPYPEYANIIQGARTGYATYHALQALFRTKIPNLLNLQAAYTWSHSIANVDESNANGLGNNVENVTDPFNPQVDRGNSTINRPQMFVANAILYLPKLTDANSLTRTALGGWELSTIATLEDGASFTIYDASSSGTGVQTGLFGTSGGFNNSRPLIVPGAGCNSNVHGQQIVNPAAFTLNGFVIGQTLQSTLEPRGYCFGPAYKNADLAIYKNFKVRERVGLQFRLDMFNAFNHVNYRGNASGATAINTEIGASNGLQGFCTQAAFAAGPGGIQNNGCSATNNTIIASQFAKNSTFGQATAALTPRQIQYGLRITF
jgi:hypothetical protein